MQSSSSEKSCFISTARKFQPFFSITYFAWVVSVRDNSEWSRPRGRPRTSWLQQVDLCCWEVPGMRRGPAWRDSRAWRRWVSEATRPPGVCPHWLIDYFASDYRKKYYTPNIFPWIFFLRAPSSAVHFLSQTLPLTTSAAPLHPSPQPP